MADKKSKKTNNEDLTPIGRALTKLEQPDVIMNMIVGLAGLCGLLVIGDFFGLRYGKMDVESYFGFYAIFGFLAFAFIIFSTKVLKKLISRKEDYYSPNVVDAEPYPEGELDVKEHGDA